METTITVKALAELLGVGWEAVEIGTCMVPRRRGGVEKTMDTREALEAMVEYSRRKIKDNTRKSDGKMGFNAQRQRRNAGAWTKCLQRAMNALEEVQ